MDNKQDPAQAEGSTHWASNCFIRRRVERLRVLHFFACAQFHSTQRLRAAFI